MDHLCRDLGQRLQDEQPFVHPWVRHHQSRLIEHSIAVEQQVEIEGARPVPFGPHAIQRLFHLQQHVQQRARRQVGLQLGGGVEVFPLPRWSADRFGFVKRRHLGDTDAGLFAQRLHARSR